MSSWCSGVRGPTIACILQFTSRPRVDDLPPQLAVRLQGSCVLEQLLGHTKLQVCRQLSKARPRLISSCRGSAPGDLPTCALEDLGGDGHRGVDRVADDGDPGAGAVLCDALAQRLHDACAWDGSVQCDGVSRHVRISRTSVHRQLHSLMTDASAAVPLNTPAGLVLLNVMLLHCCIARRCWHALIGAPDATRHTCTSLIRCKTRSNDLHWC